MSTKEVNSTAFETSRLARLGRIVATCGFAWIAFGSYYLISGRMMASCNCLIQGVLAVAFYSLARSRPDWRRRLSTLYVLSLVTGLTVDSYLLNNPVSPMFFCCAMLVAILTLGSRNIGKWILACVVLTFLINFFPDALPNRPGTTHLDRTLAYITLLGVVASCCLIAESTAQAYARRLETVTGRLEERTNALDEMVGVDLLTSLRNRRRFLEDATRLLRTQKASSFALLLIDLNCFKLINDRYGHATGDTVLRNFSIELQDTIGDDADVYRLGGDEFVAIVSNPSRIELMKQARKAANSVLSIVSTSGLLDATSTLKLGVSVGIALYPEHAGSVDELISCADKAMYKAKASEDSIVFFETWMAEAAEREQILRDNLDLAIENEEFTLHYQPQVNVNTNRIVGVEALIRWDRDGETVSPIHFVPCLEASGKIVEVGDWVLREACRQLRQWRNKGFELKMSVNVSSLQIQQPSFADTVLQVLAGFQLPNNALDLEVTETLLLEHDGHAHENIERLTQQDVHFSIDDFGTGYSSLAYLKELTVDRLKIDRSFIKDFPEADDGMIAETVITLAKHMDMTVIAEGVETETQLAFLREHDCEEYQGYLFSKPLPANECQQLLEQNHPRHHHNVLVQAKT